MLQDLSYSILERLMDKITINNLISTHLIYKKRRANSVGLNQTIK